MELPSLEQARELWGKALEYPFLETRFALGPSETESADVIDYSTTISPEIARVRSCQIKPAANKATGGKLGIYRESYFRPYRPIVEVRSDGCIYPRWTCLFRPDDYPVRSSSLTKLQLAQVSLRPGLLFVKRPDAHVVGGTRADIAPQKETARLNRGTEERAGGT